MHSSFVLFRRLCAPWISPAIRTRFFSGKAVSLLRVRLDVSIPQTSLFRYFGGGGVVFWTRKGRSWPSFKNADTLCRSCFQQIDRPNLPPQQALLRNAQSKYPVVYLVHWSTRQQTIGQSCTGIHRHVFEQQASTRFPKQARTPTCSRYLTNCAYTEAPVYGAAGHRIFVYHN